MKLATRILSLLVMASLATFYMSCDNGGGDDQTEEQKQLAKLVGSWSLASAKEDGVERTDFDGLVLTLSGTYVSDGGIYQYSFSGTRPNPSPWPGSGSWKFGSNVISELIRDPQQQGGTAENEIVMGYNITDTQLTIEFTVPDGHTGWAGSRAKTVTGDWVFVFTKQ